MMDTMPFDDTLRQSIYQNFIRRRRAPKVSEMAAALSCSVGKVRDGLKELSRTHAFVLQENGELWRAAPFSAVPTPFPVRMGKRQWWGNCIWDALGIPAMLHQDASIAGSCGCCNLGMDVNVTNAKLTGARGVIHIAVPARHWYDDIVFT
jgi:hypothetical protein